MTKSIDDRVPWLELMAMTEIEQEKWWSEFLTPINLKLVAKIYRESNGPGIPHLTYTDCVIRIIGDNADLVYAKLKEKKRLRATAN